MRLEPEPHRIIRYLAQQHAAKRSEVSEGTLSLSLGMSEETVRHHIDQLEGSFVSVQRKLETANRWIRLLPAGEDYARAYGIL